MSNSFKKVCVRSLPKSDKFFQRNGIKRYRRLSKQLLNVFMNDTILPHYKYRISKYTYLADHHRLIIWPFEIKKDNCKDWKIISYIKRSRK